ncbi:glycosyltransferase [Marinobacter fonticola]|uniref:glycosyltransferase n=1 Tax=Marinobacter fonticola TaxID=2603215 RepID=UPI0011E706EC|nr:glycosyltransferase [Marinobacter fonticola]
MIAQEPRILIVTDKCDLSETQWILGLHEAGARVAVACNPAGRYFGDLDAAGIVRARIALTGRFDKTGTRQIQQVIDDERIDVMHCFNPRALACGLRAARGRKVAIAAYRGVIGNIDYLNPESWITFLHPRLNRIVCVSDAVKRYFLGLSFLWMRLPERKVVRIYKGHKLEWYEGPPADLSAFGFPQDAFVFCCTGRDRPGKGFRTLIEAMDHIPDDMPVYLLLVGKLDENAELTDRIRASRHADRIKLAGFRTDAPQVAAACDAMVLPSESEGLPRVVIEAMAYERPVVVTEAGGMPELVDDGVEGYVVPVRNAKALADAFIRLASDRDAATAMGQRGRERIGREFTNEATVRETRVLYQDMLDELSL